jgi:glycine reductase complex component B subunit alpha and beta
VRLELASFPASELSIDDAVESLTLGDPRLASVEIDVVRPGDPVRVINVLDAVEPMIKPNDPDATFPGMLGALRHAGNGRTNRVEGCAVLACAAVTGGDQQEGVIDMGGPGSHLTPFCQTTNVVLTIESAPGISGEETMAAIAEVKLRAARDIAVRTLELEPDRVDVLEHRLGGKPGSQLPAVALLVQLAALGPYESVYLYGTTLDGFQPAPLNPLEVLDGAVVSGESFWAALRNPTYSFQNSALVRDLLDADGRSARFVGLIACRGYNQGAREKERASMLAAKLARELGADGAIVTTDGGGNSHTDTMLTVRACEREGIRAVALVAELGGLTDHVPEADAIISVGNAEELVPAWPPTRVVGGANLIDGRDACDAGPIPVRNYLGATQQMGQMPLRAVAA